MFVYLNKYVLVAIGNSLLTSSSTKTNHILFYVYIIGLGVLAFLGSENIVSVDLHLSSVPCLSVGINSSFTSVLKYICVAESK